MKRILFSILTLASFATGLSACGDDKPSPNPPAEEAQIAFTLQPEPGTAPVQTTSAGYSFNVVLSAALPAQGVEVKVVHKKDSDGTTLSDQTLSSQSSPVAVSLGGIPFNELGTVTVTVTSKSKASNNATKTFKLVRK